MHVSTCAAQHRVTFLIDKARDAGFERQVRRRDLAPLLLHVYPTFSVSFCSSPSPNALAGPVHCPKINTMNFLQHPRADGMASLEAEDSATPTSPLAATALALHIDGSCNSRRMRNLL
jgi:hypothetical protein